MRFRDFFSIFNIVALAPPRYKTQIVHLFRIFFQTDSHTKLFQRKSGLQCKSGCGKCCENPNIETTVFEMLPAAIELIRKGQVKKYYALAKKGAVYGDCIFYKRDPIIDSHGRCGMYLFRPLVCRLFGFSGRKDKFGKKELLTCSIIKSMYPKEIGDLKNGSGEYLPVSQEFAIKAYGLNPSLGKEHLPINEALKQAIEQVMLFKKSYFKVDS